MTEKDVIRVLLYENRMSQAQLAKVAGFKGQTNITGFLNNNNHGIRMDNFLRLIHAMGCKLIVTSNDMTMMLEIDGVPENWKEGDNDDAR